MYKQLVYLFVVTFLIFACKKTDTKSVLENRKTYLIGYGVTSTNWKLKGLTVDTIPQTLTGSQLGYCKQYFSTSNFADTDGATGSWSFPVTDSLKEVFTNYPSGVIVKQSYYINFLSYDSLSLTYLLNGKITNARFKAIR
jgi:hypothetical protein